MCARVQIAAPRWGILDPSAFALVVKRRFTMIKKFVAPLLAATFVAGTFATLSGCNTIEGAGKDVEAGGKAVKNEARETKNKM
jgi:predicted small secreted protein